MKATLSKLAKENTKLQASLEAVLKDEKLYEVRYKWLHLEAQKTWKSGLNHKAISNQSRDANYLYHWLPELDAKYFGNKWLLKPPLIDFKKSWVCSGNRTYISIAWALYEQSIP